MYCNLIGPTSSWWLLMNGWRGERQKYVKGQKAQSAEIILHI